MILRACDIFYSRSCAEAQYVQNLEIGMSDVKLADSRGSKGGFATGPTVNTTTTTRISSTMSRTMSTKRSKSPSAYRKPCDMCQILKDVLVRCRIDETNQWHFVCTSKCWKKVSGGEIDGTDDKQYVYGGMWKNKHAGVSAKKPKNKSALIIKDWSENQSQYITNARVKHNGKIWICRRSHDTTGKSIPGTSYRYWKEDIHPPPKAEGSAANPTDDL